MRLFSLAVLLFFLNCGTSQKLDIQGHRGCRGLLPENTLPAFKKAIELGVTTLELDLAISKDHKIIVSHEPFMNHEIALDVFGNEIDEADEKRYNLYQMTFDSIQLYDCGSKVHPRFPSQEKMRVFKPLLSEVIQMSESVSKKEIKYNIEIKSLPEYDGFFSPEVEEFVRLALDVIKTEGIFKRTTLQSFDIRALEAIHKQAPKMKIALLVDENESMDKKLSQLTFKPNIISPYFELLNSILVEEFHRQNFLVIPWTLNTQEDIQRMLHLRVDGIISDYPPMLLKIYNSKL